MSIEEQLRAIVERAIEVGAWEQENAHNLGDPCYLDLAKDERRLNSKKVDLEAKIQELLARLAEGSGTEAVPEGSRVMPDTQTPESLPRPSTPPVGGTASLHSYSCSEGAWRVRCMFCDAVWDRIDGVWIMTEAGKGTCVHP